MRKAVLFLIVPDGFRDEEYSIPKKILEDHGLRVVTSSTLLGRLDGKKGLTTATVDILLSKVRAADYAGLVIIGGQKTFWNNSKIINLIQEMNGQNKVIAAICISGVLPAQAGLMQGKPSTVFPDALAIAELAKYGAVYKADPVVVAGNIITANGPEAAQEFANAIIKQLS